MDVDVSDPLLAYETWVATADHNSKQFDEIDGPSAFDKCGTIDEYNKAVAERERDLDPSNPVISNAIEQIRGHLVNYPLAFLSRESYTGLEVLHSLGGVADIFA
jgi:hypothetical protein